MNNDIAIKVENLSKCYTLRHAGADDSGRITNELWALKDISFEIKKGESIGIIGPNGSGKSTLLKVLAGVSKPTSGKVQIRGRVASILDIGAGFHPELSGRENVFMNGQLLGFKRREIEAKYDEIVSFSGIEKFMEEPVKNYSSGMYLRLAFSIMAHLDFDVYLLDEVLRVGDAEFSVKVNKKIKELTLSSKTIVFVSHNINELENQEKFIHIEHGILKKIGKKRVILSDYIESKKHFFDENSLNRQGELNEHPLFDKCIDLKVNKIKIYQTNNTDTDIFRTDRETIVEVDYFKKKNTDTLDLFLLFSDNNEQIFLISSPFVADNLSSESESRNYHLKCTLPAMILNSQVYNVSILFLKNADAFYGRFEEINNNSLKEDETIEIALSLDNIIKIKSIFYKENKEIDLSSINVRGNLFAAFDWQLDHSPDMNNTDQ